MGTPPPAPRGPTLLLLLLLLPCLATPGSCLSFALTPPILDTPPKVINATNETLTFVADASCPRNCDVKYITWQAKAWVNRNWPQGEVAPANLPFTFTRLVPGVRYDVRALLQRADNVTYISDQVPVAKAFTCSNDPDVRVPSIWQQERNDTHVEVWWKVPRGTCIATRFVLQRGPFEQRFNASGCPPPYVIDPQPAITCSPETRHEDRCTAAIDGIAPKERKYIGIVAIDWMGRCSRPDWIYTIESHEHPLGGVQIALIGSLVLAAILLAGLIPVFYKCRKRFVGRGAAGQRFTFSRMKPNAAAPAQGPVEIDRDGYLLSDSQTSRSPVTPLEQPMS